MEFSISGNIGMNYSEDIDERSRQIFLAYFEEEANGQSSRIRFCTAPCANTAGESYPQSPLSSGNGNSRECPKARHSRHTRNGRRPSEGSWVQTTWETRVCRSKMTFNVRGDQKTEAMTAIYEVCHNVRGEAWIRKDDLYSTIHEAVQDTEDNSASRLSVISVQSRNTRAQANRKRLGYALREYNLRILDGIMEIDKASANRGRHRYRFTKPREIGPDIITSEY